MKYEVFIMVENREKAMELRDKLYQSNILTEKEKRYLGFNKLWGKNMCMKKLSENIIAVCTLENIMCDTCGKFKGNIIRENKKSLFDTGAKLIFLNSIRWKYDK